MAKFINLKEAIVPLDSITMAEKSWGTYGRFQRYKTYRIEINYGSWVSIEYDLESERDEQFDRLANALLSGTDTEEPANAK